MQRFRESDDSSRSLPIATARSICGLEQYRSISASTDGRRIVATVANSFASLAAVPLLDRIAEERDITPYEALAAPARMPRFGRHSLFYSSAHTAVAGLWRLQDGESVEIWRGTDDQVVSPPPVHAMKAAWPSCFGGRRRFSCG